ncbi:hypothetical protein [Cerasicoccus maritimus]|uniref:hypothetical protein n=1 Tax=Cerasicoccus maritimus TaxID=490089 RepID=UPI002852A18B|nr:hypothetical protein [Cerasicoccus maritimus]
MSRIAEYPLNGEVGSYHLCLLLTERKGWFHLRGRLKTQVVFAGVRLRGQNIISSSRRNWFRLDSEAENLPLEYISPTRSDFLDALSDGHTVDGRAITEFEPRALELKDAAGMIG